MYSKKSLLTEQKIARVREAKTHIDGSERDFPEWAGSVCTYTPLAQLCTVKLILKKDIYMSRTVYSSFVQVAIQHRYSELSSTHSILYQCV